MKKTSMAVLIAITLLLGVQFGEAAECGNPLDINSRAHKMTWSTVVLVLGKLDSTVFREAGCKAIADVTDGSREDTVMTAQEIHNVFTKIRGAKPRSGLTENECIRGIISQLNRRQETLLDLANTVSGLYDLSDGSLIELHVKGYEIQSGKIQASDLGGMDTDFNKMLCGSKKDIGPDGTVYIISDSQGVFQIDNSTKGVKSADLCPEMMRLFSQSSEKQLKVVLNSDIKKVISIDLLQQNSFAARAR